MGNGVSCPVGFIPGGFLTCVATCPADKGLENRSIANEARCVYKSDETRQFVLTPVGIVSLDKPGDPAPTLAWLQTNRPAQYTAYKQAQDDFTSKSSMLLDTIAKERQVADAFRDLQAAENVRDTSPQAYQDARVRYYTLTKGDTWIQEERKRLLDAEVLPNVASYMQSINSLTQRQAQQASTKSAVDTVKTKLLSLKDDFRTTTTTLSKQVTELRNQIELEKRRSAAQSQQTNEWFINIVLIVLSLVVIYVLYRRVTRNPSPMPVYRPAYTMGAR